MVCKNVLIVEDDVSIRQSMQDVLEISGYTVHTAANGIEGLEKLEILAGTPCVILLDMMMPKMNGWQFLDVQRTDPRYKNIPVVVCSAYEEISKSVHPDGFLSKPLQFSALIGAVKSHCA